MSHFSQPISLSRGAILAAAIWFGAAAFAADVNQAVPSNPASPLPDAADAFDVLPSRRLGDAALAAAEYAGAEAHYRAYRAAAVARGNAAAVQDATLRIINVRLQSGDAAGAKAAADEFAAAFAPGNVYVLKLLEADMAMLKGDYSGAEKLMRAQLANAELPTDLRKPLSYALGEALMRQGKYADAATVYADITARKPEFDAAYRRIFALQLGDELIASQNLLNELKPDPAIPGQQPAAAQLQINQAIRERRFSEAAAMWRLLPEISPDRRLYLMALELAEHFRESGIPDSRVEFLKAAFNASPGADERKYVLALLIGQYATDRNEAAAIEAMSRYLTLFPADSDRFANLIQLARLMTAAANFSGASAVYGKLLDDPGAPKPLKLQAARECVGVCEQLADRKNERRMLEFMIANSTTDIQLAEANLAMANFLFNSEDFNGATEHARKAAAAATPSRLAALYTLMNARQRAQDYPAALEAARELKNQPDKEWRQKGTLGEARVLEASGDIQGAISAYAAFGSSWEFSDSRQEALFSAGMLAMESGYYARASELFKLLAERYPKYQASPYALYLSVYAEYMQQRPSEMEKLISALRKDFPNSKYTVDAMLWQLDLLKLNRDFAGAEKLLASMAQEYAGREPEVVEQIRYEQACLELASGRDEAAAELLNKVVASEAPRALRAKSELALGDIEMKAGRYVEAEARFKHALELAPDEEFRLSCIGRIADSYYASGAKDEDVSKLEGAVVFYSQVLNAAAPKSQAWYQAGCMVGISELRRGKPEIGTAQLFTVIGAAAKDAGITPEAAWWVRKAANTLVNHVISDGSPEDQAKLVESLRKLRVSGTPNEFGVLWFEANCRLAESLGRRGDRRAARECYSKLISEAASAAPLSEAEENLLLVAAESLTRLCIADGSAAALDVALKALDSAEKINPAGRARIAALRGEVTAAYNLK